MKSRNLLILLALVSGIIYMAGCNKNPSGITASLVGGTWVFNNEHVSGIANGQNIDTTFTKPTLIGIHYMTFLSNGTLQDSTDYGRDTAMYTFTGSTLTIPNNSGPSTSIQINTLSAHSLVFQVPDTGTHTNLTLTETFSR